MSEAVGFCTECNTKTLIHIRGEEGLVCSYCGLVHDAGHSDGATNMDDLMDAMRSTDVTIRRDMTIFDSEVKAAEAARVPTMDEIEYNMGRLGRQAGKRKTYRQTSNIGSTGYRIETAMVGSTYATVLYFGSEGRELRVTGSEAKARENHSDVTDVIVAMNRVRPLSDVPTSLVLDELRKRLT